MYKSDYVILVFREKHSSLLVCTVASTQSKKNRGEYRTTLNGTTLQQARGSSIRMPRALLRAVVPLSRNHEKTDDADHFALLPRHENVTEAAASAANSPDNLIRWLANYAMVSLHELVEDSKGEVSTLKVTILAVAAVHVVALVRGQSTSPERSSPRPAATLCHAACSDLFLSSLKKVSFVFGAPSFRICSSFFPFFLFCTSEGSRVRGRLELY